MRERERGRQAAGRNGEHIDRHNIYIRVRVDSGVMYWTEELDQLEPKLLHFLLPSIRASPAQPNQPTNQSAGTAV